MKTEFSTFDIVKGLDIQRGRLREWMNYEFISPSVKADGQGTRAVFNLFDVQCVALFRNLIEYGFNREAAAGFLKDFTKQIKKEKNNPETVYIFFRSKIKDGKAVSDVMRLGPGAWKFDIEAGNIDWGLSNTKFKLSGDEVRIPADNLDGPLHKHKSWRNVLMINYKEICEEVNRAMGKG